MTDEEIISRIDSGEDSRTQFKREAIGVNDLAKELAAFANAEGGVILFGVDDDGSVAGLTKKQSAAVNTELSNAANDNVRPSVYPRTEFHRIGGKTVLAVIVREGVSKPYADKHGSFWTMNGPDKRRVTAREELQRMLQKSLLIHADELRALDEAAMLHLPLLQGGYASVRALYRLAAYQAGSCDYGMRGFIDNVRRRLNRPALAVTEVPSGMVKDVVLPKYRVPEF